MQRAGAITVGVSSVAVTSAAVAVVSRRWNSYPGWHRSASTKDVRTREQRELDRKARQIEKLPRPEALHDFQYPYEKAVLCDGWLQPPVYADELDTPQLFNLTPPSDFFLFFQAGDFGRPQYPAVPAVDHRTLAPTDAAYGLHLEVARGYMEKHGVAALLPQVSGEVNMSVVFNRADATVLDRTTFWTTAHCGNFIELSRCQQAPSVFLRGEPGKKYALFMVCPDYPYRAETPRNFFLHGVIGNLTASADGAVVSTGDVIVPFVPPLPTEDAGAARILCVLLPQVEGATLAAPSAPLTFEQRAAYRMHDPVAGAEAPLHAVEAQVSATPAAVTFFQTAWDIQVQEWYAAAGRPEPAYVPEDVVGLLRYNALPESYHRVSSRHQADGSVSDDTVLEQTQPLVPMQSSATAYLSRRTLLSKDKKEFTRPRQQS